MEKKVNWGILGCAGIAGRAFVPGARGASNAVLHGIAARDPARALKWAEVHGFRKAYGDYAELVADPEIDAIYNPLPNNLHAEWSIRAARAGKHVLCEKPMAMNAGEVLRMREAADESGVLLMEAFMYKFHPQMEKTLELVAGGEIGRLRSVHASFTFVFEDEGVNYRWFPGMGGGALLDVGCYTINVSRLVFGAEPVSVLARARFHPEHGVDVSTHMLLEFPGGRFAQCDCGFDSQFQSRLIVVGDKGKLNLNRAFSAKHLDVEIEVVKGDSRRLVFIPKTDQFARMIEHFGLAVLGKASLRYPSIDAERNMKVIDACFDSIRTGLPVAL